MRKKGKALLKSVPAPEESLAAEAQLAVVSPSPSPMLPPQNEELGAVLEELDVAQEELQEQNEELLRMCRILEAEHQRYLHLFEIAPDAYLVTDLNGVIQETHLIKTARSSSPSGLSGCHPRHISTFAVN
jgi:hypothetical protein